MVETEPVAVLGEPFSSPGAAASEWAEGRRTLRDAEIYWLSTVRPDGQANVTPLIGIWLDGAWYFCTGPTERKAANLARNPRCAVTTGCNGIGDGFDVVVEGSAVAVTDGGELGRVADTFESKYGPLFTDPEGTFSGLGDSLRRGDVPVYRVAPVTAFGFRKGREFSQTRWSFS